MAIFRRFVEIGRVVVLNRGTYNGKTAVITNVIDQNRVLLSGPTTGVPRHSVPLSWLYLTDIVVKGCAVGQRNKPLVELMKKQNVDENWAKSKWARNLENAKKRANTSDFDRFKLAQARKIRSQLIKQKLAALRQAHNKKVISEKKNNLVLPTGQWK